MNAIESHKRAPRKVVPYRMIEQGFRRLNALLPPRLEPRCG